MLRAACVGRREARYQTDSQFGSVGNTRLVEWFVRVLKLFRHNVTERRT